MKLRIDLIAKFGYAFALLLHILQTSIIKKLPTLSQFSVYDILFFRNIFSTVILSCILILNFKKIPYKQITKDDLFLILLTSFCYIIATYCWHIGVSEVALNNAVIVSFFVPIVITFMSKIFLKEKLNYLLILSLLVCFLTTVFLYKPSFNRFNNGYFILLIDVVSYSVATIFRKRIASKLGTVFIIFLANVIMIPFSLALSNKPYALLYQPNLPIFLLFLIAFIYCIEILISTKCTTLIAISELQPIKFLRIVFSILLSSFILHEMPTNTQIIAFILILLANSVAFFRK